MNALIAILLALFLLSALGHAGEATAPFLKPAWDARRLREGFRGKAAGMMVSYWLMDRTHQGGRGNSNATT